MNNWWYYLLVSLAFDIFTMRIEVYERSRIKENISFGGISEALRKGNAAKEERTKLLEKFDRMIERLLVFNVNSQMQMVQSEELKQMIADHASQIKKLQKENASLKVQKRTGCKKSVIPKVRKW